VVCSEWSRLPWNLEKNMLTIGEQESLVEARLEIAYINIHLDRQSVVQFAIMLLGKEMEDLHFSIPFRVIHINFDLH
jgi:hypothetical protein